MHLADFSFIRSHLHLRRRLLSRLTDQALRPWRRRPLTGRGPRTPPAEAAGYTALAKYLLNNSSDLRAPSSLRTTDLAFDLGSEMKPWACSRSNVSQSNPFHARVTPWSVWALK